MPGRRAEVTSKGKRRQTECHQTPKVPKRPKPKPDRDPILTKKKNNGYKSKPATPNGWRQMDERSPSCSTDTKTRQGGATEAHNGPQIAKRRQTIPKETKRRHGLAMGRHGGPWRAMECQRSAEGHKEAPPQTVGAPWPLGATPRARTRDPQHTHTTIHPQRQEHITDRSAQGNACQCRNGQTANHESAAGSPKSGHRMATANHVLPDYGHDLPPIERRYVFRFNSYVLDYRRKNQHHRSGFQNVAQPGQLGGRQLSTIGFSITWCC